MSYELTWLTSQLAVGYAPMSYEELDSIRDQGVGAIINLCGEFTDLHEIEEQAGFEVYFLPTPDECAPDIEKMEHLQKVLKDVTLPALTSEEGILLLDGVKIKLHEIINYLDRGIQKWRKI